MTTITGFVDEMTKIAASSYSAMNPKSRAGRRPIRVDKLLKKAQAPVIKATPGLIGALQKAAPFLSAHGKTLGTMGLTGAAVLAGRQGIEDLRRGRQYRLAMEGQR